ncbi:MAG: glycosyltransferase family 4 protein [Steroidobacteraceae bacterium]
MARILIDARKLRSSTGRYVRELLSRLEHIDSDNQYVVLGNAADFSANGEHCWQPAAPNFTTVICDIPHYTFREQLLLPLLLYRCKPDLVHFWMPQQPLLYLGKKVATIHDLHYVQLKIYNRGKITYEIRQLIFKIFLKLVARTNKALITPTVYTKKELVGYTHCDPSKVVVTHEGASEELTHALEPCPAMVGKQFLLYVGQSAEYKGQMELIKALQILRRQYPALELAVVGKPNSYTEYLERTVRTAGYQGVQFLGFLPDTQLAWLYCHAATYVQPSRSEGFGLMNLEAMMCGCPVASSNATCLPEVCGAAAEYFDPLDPEDMARAIHMILSSGDHADRLRQLGYEQVKKYSWERMAMQTLAIYQQTLRSYTG